MTTVDVVQKEFPPKPAKPATATPATTAVQATTPAAIPELVAGTQPTTTFTPARAEDDRTAPGGGTSSPTAPGSGGGTGPGGGAAARSAQPRPIRAVSSEGGAIFGPADSPTTGDDAVPPAADAGLVPTRFQAISPQPDAIPELPPSSVPAPGTVRLPDLAEDGRTAGALIPGGDPPAPGSGAGSGNPPAGEPPGAGVAVVPPTAPMAPIVVTPPAPVVVVTQEPQERPHTKLRLHSWLSGLRRRHPRPATPGTSMCSTHLDSAHRDGDPVRLRVLHVSGWTSLSVGKTPSLRSSLGSSKLSKTPPKATMSNSEAVTTRGSTHFWDAP